MKDVRSLVPLAVISIVIAGALVMARTSDAHAQSGSGCDQLLQFLCPPPQCRDGVDNDRDGVSDLADPGCGSREGGNEWDDIAPDVNGDPVPGPDVDPRQTDKLFGLSTGLSLWDGTPPEPDSGVSADEETALIRAIGGNAQRFGIQWFLVEPARGRIDAAELNAPDRLYGELRAHGMTPIITVLQAPAWASDYASCFVIDLVCRYNARKQDHLPPRDIPAYADFVQRMAERYPDAIVEPWNEPNVRGYWNADPWPNAARMAAMQCAAYDAVKSANPDQRVAGPGLAYIGSYGPPPGQFPYLDFVRQLYQHMEGRICWDVLSVHVYASSDVDGDGSSTAEAFRVIRNTRAEFGDTTPIWVTETGASTSGGKGEDHGHTERTFEEQEQIIRATVNELLATADVGAVLLHTLRDRPGFHSGADDPNTVVYGFGLLDDGPGPYPPPKPSWCHFIGVVNGTYPGC